MIYTVIHTNENDMLGTCTFVSQRHDKNYAWAEFIEKHAEEGQSPVAIVPGNHVVYFPQHISFTQVA